MSRTDDASVFNVPILRSDASFFTRVHHVEPISRDVVKTLEETLTPMEKLVIGWDRVDPFAGIGWTGNQSRCMWRDDGRRVTFFLTPPHGHGVSVSIAPDPLYAELGPRPDPEPADQAVP